MKKKTENQRRSGKNHEREYRELVQNDCYREQERACRTN
jgi:hypothetical protein